MKYGVISTLMVSVSWAFLAILQLWFSFLTAGIFIKVTVSAAILVGVLLIITLVIREYFSDQKLKKDGFITE